MRRLLGAALGLLALQGAADAQTYPARPVTMVVPVPAGSPTDVIGRLVAEGMRDVLGQPVVIDNVAGASGSLAAGRVARSAPDGYTISLGSGTTHVSNGAVYDLKYHVFDDFEPVSLLAAQPMVIVTRKDFPANNLKELIDWLKANPDKISQGTSGAGSSSHLAGTLFQRETGTRYQYVPYRNTGMPDVMSGVLDLMIDPAANSVPQVRAGTIKAHAITGRNRIATIPDVPTVAEAGLPQMVVTSWHGLWTPKGTPKSVIDKLNAAVVAALAEPTVRKRLLELGQEIPTLEQQTPAALAAHHKSEIERWWPVIRAAGIKPQ
jgi:tripartite-type tricarboxylate transporter receptor subunit TctC